MIRTFFMGILLLLGDQLLQAQELQARVTVLSQQVGSGVDKTVFSTLQSELSNLLNNRKWTNDVFQPQERISCSFLLNVESVVSENEYRASLTIQAARPVYNSSYQAVLVNFKDPDLTFRYVKSQPISFDENRVQGMDALTSNLSATFAFYVYTILGIDYDSFSPKGGAPYFQKAQNIVSNAPEATDISGWKPFDGLRNRYWLSDNLNNSKFNIIHDVIYGYYRSGLDSMYTSQPAAQASILTALSKLEDFNRENPNTMILQFFMQGKFEELVGIFKNAAPEVKSSALNLLSQLDIGNISNYKDAFR